MTVPDIKEKLIEKINATTNTSILEEVYEIFEFQEQEGIYEINSEQRKAIEEARAQIENHQVLSNDEANNKTDEWLSK
ncbi:MAG: hypothetical protein ABI419_06940 [Ginsengibacter sp.]